MSGVNYGASVDSSRADEFRRAYLANIAREMHGLRLDGCVLRSIAPMAVGLWSGSQFLNGFGAEVDAFHDKPNGRNINENCGLLYLAELQARVRQTGAHIGVAFDGYADRGLFVNEKGDIVDGDGTLWIMAKYFQDRGMLKNNIVVATVMSNIGLEIALRSRQIELIRTSVGDKYVLEKLLLTEASIGGEQSGHIIFPEKSLIGDGMMSATYLLEAIKEKGEALSQMTAGFTQFPQTLVNVRVNKKPPFDEIPEVAKASNEIESELNGKGRLLLRYSGTENLARVMIEGEDQASIENQAAEIGRNDPRLAIG